MEFNIALGIYQHLSTANKVLKELKKNGYLRIATIKSKEGIPEVNRNHSLFIQTAIFLAIFLIVVILLTYIAAFQHPFFALHTGLGSVFIAALLGMIYGLNRQKIDTATVDRFKNLVVKDETFIMVQVKAEDVRNVLRILRQVESGHPLSFLLRPDLFKKEDIGSDLHKEPLSMEQLRKHAVELSETMNPVKVVKESNSVLLKRLNACENILQIIRYDIAAAEDIEQSITISGEWFLDNMYVIQGSIEDVKRNLPQKFYQELPKIQSGTFKDLPRIYFLASELIKSTGGKLNRENVVDFISGFQTHLPLTIGEIWALPLMLRLRLVEGIQQLALHIDSRMREGELASFWGNRLLQMAHMQPARLEKVLAELQQEQQMPSAHFAEELMDHLFDEVAVLPQVKAWLEKKFNKPMVEVIHEEQILETSEQTTFANTVTSLIALTQLSWQTIFEELSPVDAILNQDPLEVYANMDFASRDFYRHAIETLAKGSKKSEVEIARIALALANHENKPFSRHVGYFLVDAGREILERKIEYSPTFIRSLKALIKKHPSAYYLGGVSLITILLETILIVSTLQYNITTLEIISLAVLALFVLSEIAVQCLNVFTTQFLPPCLLPKMSYEKGGVPTTCKTLVVVPMMLLTKDTIQREVERLEIRYLANIESNILFGLISDFSDAPQQVASADHELLQIAEAGIQALNAKYGSGKFFLFHRQRSWSASEGAWIGHERKRGKLESLNQYLLGDHSENILRIGNSEDLNNVRYVITLDADTQLPKDKARHLIETISHPLNQAYLSDDLQRVLRGYSIIQPRVNTDFLNAKCSWFVKIFSDPSSIDPYTQAISDVYQDLNKEGTYHGKGIYDVFAFHNVLKTRFPDEHLLSHDLIEGAFVKVGFASDVCLFDLFPENYFSWSYRHHRWMRGDWQIIDWLFPKVPTRDGKKVKNPLSIFNRWKIFDNLRRALFPLCAVLLLITAWLGSSIPWLWTFAVIAPLFLPSFIALALQLTGNPKDFKQHFHDFMMGLLRGFVVATLLPHQAYSALDALLRVIYRRLISHRHLLEWSVNRSKSNTSPLSLLWVTTFGIVVFGAVLNINPIAIWAALPFCLMWACSPWIIYVIDRPLLRGGQEQLTAVELQWLRHLSRKTWRFFDDFVNQQSHWLPPDNYQAALNVEVAQRTSPTNIGLWMVSALSAYDLGYISFEDFVERVLATTRTLKKLERFQGHFLNWYDTSTMDPLYPRYISTVDSGNMLASFWTVQQGLYTEMTAPLISPSVLSGIKDTVYVLYQHEVTSHSELRKILDAITNLTQKTSNNYGVLMLKIRQISELLEKTDLKTSDTDAIYWLNKLKEQVQRWVAYSHKYLSWIEVLNSLPHNLLVTIDEQAPQWHSKAFLWKPSLEELASEQIPEGFTILIQKSQHEEMPQRIKEWGDDLNAALLNSQAAAREKCEEIRELDQELTKFSDSMNFQYLYNKDRKVFAIGYNVDSQRLDNSFYDLLASEARIASLVAIAKGDVPIQHWWALGRPYSYTQGNLALLSWGGTMFEYLMPILFTKHYPGSLLGKACEAAVACQIGYGNKLGIIWGISESAYSMIDQRKTYQYRSFGVPGLGLKRGLEEDLVVSPYSTMLALTINSKECMKNLKRLAHTEHAGALGHYGYYESIDYTRQSSPGGERGVIVYAYMAHHQGMSFIQSNNFLNQGIMNTRFHADPRISGIESLLYERVPSTPTVAAKFLKKDIPSTRLQPFSKVPIMGIVETPESLTPKVNLLSNGKYSVMVTNAGGGYSKWNNLDITRWRADTTRDFWGSFCYIKDVQTGDFWSTAYQPTLRKARQYSVSFKADKAEFQRKDNQIETVTEVVVSPEDNAEVRLITLTNLSPKTRILEMTSYSELALAPHVADRSHPCFNKFFIETKALPDQDGLLAFRRLRAADEAPVYAGHVLAMRPMADQVIQFETDRSKFIGRNRTLQNPEALHRDLQNSEGTVLDPIFSIRQTITLEPGQQIQLSFVTVIGDDLQTVLGLIEKYRDLSASHRALEMAWTYAQLELRHLSVHQEDAQLFQKLASRMIYPHKQLRASNERLKSNKLGQSGLWAHGISGDLPILVLTIGDLHDTELVRQVLVAHTFWRLRGLMIDLVILNEELTTYEHPLLHHLKRMVEVYAYRNQVEVPGGIFLRNIDQLTDDEITLILFTARVILVAARGTLRQQLVSPIQLNPNPPALRIDRRIKDEPSKPLPFMELVNFNGYGGFTKDGRHYAIYLGPDTETPAPWINVIANPNFGVLVSESGLGATWFGNSQSNRITPWSNDPTANAITDAIYIRDEELGVYWSPTPGPIREMDPYRINHGQGYTRFEHNSHGIDQELLVFVPVDDAGGMPMRIQIVKLTNSSSRKRKLTVTSYSELVLGTDKEETQTYIVSEWDPESQSIFARNRYNPNFGNYLAFANSVPAVSSYTADRTEFIGRNSPLSAPEALNRQYLSGKCGAALDPCAALQVSVDLEPGETKEVAFILGYTTDEPEARKLILPCQNMSRIHELFEETKKWWNTKLDLLKIDVPDASVNFLLNRWLPYQNLSCRIWGRTAFYQSSGAFGFRDQLQDVLALVYTQPEISRQQILRAASRQFIEGDVQHWWHPESGGGVRTRISDDLLWLPFVTAQYIRTTGDKSILDEVVPYIQAPVLQEDQHEIYIVPEISSETGTILDHCRRAMNKGFTSGPRGLLLMGGGDWNDGMNRVGIEGKGESVWLSWFMIHVMHDFADILEMVGQNEAANGYRVQSKRLAEVIETSSWDGEWYIRAFYDDGLPLGSHINTEATIDSLAQSWSVISGLGNVERSDIALQSAEKHLVDKENKVVKLLTPPFDKTVQDPGYIKGYPPGIRENGGQYTHGSSWLAMAFARRRNGDKAVDLLKMMQPILHSDTMEISEKYKTEPYVLAADIYSLPGHEGRGGWTWYTGSAGWVYRVWLEEVLGFKLRGNVFHVDCSIPKDWEGFKIEYAYRTSLYKIEVQNPNRTGHGVNSIEVDGVKLVDVSHIDLKDDGQTHNVKIVLA